MREVQNGSRVLSWARFPDFEADAAAFMVLPTRQEGGYWAQCVELDGCITQGDTLDELKTNREDVLNLMLDEPADSKLVFNLPREPVKGWRRPQMMRWGHPRHLDAMWRWLSPRGVRPSRQHPCSPAAGNGLAAAGSCGNGSRGEPTCVDNLYLLRLG
jgi:predicted RNase H-like HicB family nuclease